MLILFWHALEDVSTGLTDPVSAYKVSITGQDGIQYAFDAQSEDGATYSVQTQGRTEYRHMPVGRRIP